MKLRAIVTTAAVVMALGAAPASAGPDGSIDLFFVNTGVVDLGACQGNTLFFAGAIGQIQISMKMRLGGATAGGVSGVEGFLEFSNPLPAPWAAQILPATGALATGDWFNASDPSGSGTADTFRGNIVYSGILIPSDCPDPVDGFVDMGTITVSGTAPFVNIPNDTYLQVVTADPVSVPACTGSLIATLCDAPVFTAVCITGGAFIINPLVESCLVGTEDVNWGGIKSLYR